MRSIRPAHVISAFLARMRNGLRAWRQGIAARGESLRMNLVRVGVATLYMVLMFVTVYAEASIRWDPRMLFWHVCFVVYEVASLCAAAVWPRMGSWAVVGIWVVSTLVPMTTTFPISAPFAVAVLGAYRLWWGLAAGAICALSRLLSFAWLIEPWPGISGAAALCGLFCLAACAGAVVSNQYETIRDRERRRAAGRNQIIIDQLHDRVCNTLSYLICAVDEGVVTADSRAGEGLSNDALRNVLEGALLDSRKAIALIRQEEQTVRHGRRRDATRVAGEAGEASRGASSWASSRAGNGSLSETAAALRDRLGAVGIEGDVYIGPSADMLIDEHTASVVTGLLEELFGNIAKYADRTARYVVCISADSHELRIDASNVIAVGRADVRESMSGAISGGSGLRRYRELAEERGGRLTVTKDGRIWSITSTWPIA